MIYNDERGNSRHLFSNFHQGPDALRYTLPSALMLTLLLIASFPFFVVLAQDLPSRDSLNPVLTAAIEKFEDRLSESAKQVYEKYRDDAPLPNQREALTGKWHGESTGDPDEKSLWSYHRKADGTLVNQMTEIDLVSKEYSQHIEQCLWAMRGRVMYEFAHNADDPDESLYVFLLESITKTEMRYRLAYTDGDPEDWPSDRDQAGPGKPVKFSEDYEEMTED